MQVSDDRHADGAFAMRRSDNGQVTASTETVMRFFKGGGVCPSQSEELPGGAAELAALVEPQRRLGCV
jgi:hypothetical protein